MSSTQVAEVHDVAKPSFTWLDHKARQTVLSKLQGFSRGQLTVNDPLGSTTVGTPSDLAVNLEVHHPKFYRHAMLGGSLSVAESYMRGDWDTNDLTGFFRLFVRNMNVIDRLDQGMSAISKLINKWYHHWHLNSKAGSKENIHAHYDLGNDFFKLWLDETMAYSSGIYLTPFSTLHESSVEKIDRICRKLALTPADHLLEIGTGWGGFAIHAAQKYGCRITTTTISQEQFDLANARIREAGLQDRITVLLQDYRDLTGQYDKLVSIEMIEAVGREFLDCYLAQCSRLLKPTGTFVLQGITIPEYGYKTYLNSVDFIQKYIFPGGCLVSTGAVLESAGRVSDFRFVHGEDFGPHYAQTLRDWRQAFHARLDAVRAQGFNDRFIRMWDYYLCYCEAAFEERFLGVVHLQLDKPGARRDPIRLSEAAAQSAFQSAG